MRRQPGGNPRFLHESLTAEVVKDGIPVNLIQSLQARILLKRPTTLMNLSEDLLKQVIRNGWVRNSTDDKTVNLITVLFQTVSMSNIIKYTSIVPIRRELYATVLCFCCA
jgi:hypothetical protein